MDAKSKSRGRLKRLNKNKWWRWLTRTALILVAVVGLLMVFASNCFFYLSHQRFPVLSHVQWDYQQNSEDTAPRPEIVGHRGSGLPSTDSKAKVGDKLIGNTTSSIQAAIDAGVDWIEIDIRESADGKLIVFHDSNVVAKTDFDPETTLWKESSGEVSDLTLDQLKTLKLNLEGSQKILTLDEVFARFPSNELRWILDIKSIGIAQEVLDSLKKKDIPEKQIKIFGDYRVLKDTKYVESGYPLGYTTLFDKNWKTMLSNPSEMFGRCDELGCKLMVVPIFFVTSTFVDVAADEEISVWCYGSNDEQDLKYATGCGVVGVIVDDPATTVGDFEERDE